MAKFPETDQIPYRYGLDLLPADITRRELLYFFSFNPTERQFLLAKGRFPAHQIVLGIHLAAYRFIGRPQFYPENTPSIIIQHVADFLKLDGEVIPLIYSDRERTRRDHIKISDPCPPGRWAGANLLQIATNLPKHSRQKPKQSHTRTQEPPTLL